MRIPPWTRDELILACDLVARNGWHELRQTHEPVRQLSRILRSLRLHDVDLADETFRSVNSVSRKTADLASRHRDYTGKQTRGGKLEQEVLDAFLARPDEMHATAERIREAAAAGQLDALDLQHDALDDEAAVREGRILLRLHQRRERDARLRQRKINTVLAAGRPLECEVCAFHFGRTYGPLGKGYIEVHHVTPLYASGETVTSLADLALLCSNCHRMCHRSGGTSEPWRTPAELRELMLGFDAVDSGTTS